MPAPISEALRRLT